MHNSLQIKVGDKIIGENHPSFIIAEIGCGHDGIYENAEKMIAMAAEAKCDAVKFQTFKAEKMFNEYSHPEKVAQLRKWELKREWHKSLKEYAESKGLIFLSSAFSEEDVNFLEELDVPAHKISSYELTDRPLVEHIARKQKPIMMSCGIATLEEIEESISWIYSQENHALALLHCVSAYPTVYQDINLQTIPFLKERFQVPVGLSSHCKSFVDAVAAVSLGANIIEKHITYDNTLKHGDHPFALSKEELKEMVAAIRNIELALGKPKNGPSSGEKIETQWRRAVYAKTDISIGDTLTAERLVILRPSPQGSFAPKHYLSVLGKRAKKEIKRGQYLTSDAVE